MLVGRTCRKRPAFPKASQRRAALHVTEAFQGPSRHHLLTDGCVWLPPWSRFLGHVLQTPARGDHGALPRTAGAGLAASTQHSRKRLPSVSDPRQTAPPPPPPVLCCAGLGTWLTAPSPMAQARPVPSRYRRTKTSWLGWAGDAFHPEQQLREPTFISHRHFGK